MIKFARVCDNSQKTFKEGKGIVKVQGLNFGIDYDNTRAIAVSINGSNVENAVLYPLLNTKSVVDIDNITNVTKAQRKALKDGSSLVQSGKYNGLECLVYYNKDIKEFEIELDIQLLMYC